MELCGGNVHLLICILRPSQSTYKMYIIQLVLVLLSILVLQNYYIRAYTLYIMGNVQSSHDLLV